MQGTQGTRVVNRRITPRPRAGQTNRGLAFYGAAVSELAKARGFYGRAACVSYCARIVQRADGPALSAGPLPPWIMPVFVRLEMAFVP